MTLELLLTHCWPNLASCWLLYRALRTYRHPSLLVLFALMLNIFQQCSVCFVLRSQVIFLPHLSNLPPRTITNFNTLRFLRFFPLRFATLLLSSNCLISLKIFNTLNFFVVLTTNDFNISTQLVVSYMSLH